MGTSRIVRADFGGLQNLVKSLSDDHVVRVGIFGKKASRKKGSLSNAELGAIHEFGSITRHIPPRSFLRLPIHREADVIAHEAGKSAKTLFKEGKMTAVLRTIGIACERAVLRAFDTGGFGQWAPDRPGTVRRKHSSSPLIDTGQLRRSISSAVVERT